MTRAPHHPLEGMTVGSKWVLKRLIGSGGVGDVFDAEDAILKRPTAVKIIRSATDAAARRLEREAILVASARHPNICDVYDVGRLPDGRPYVVLERLFGEPLSTGIRTAHRTMPIEQMIDLFAQLLSALHAAHGAHIVHRDLSPKNVFLVDRVGLPPVVKILDFGLARDLSNVHHTLVPPGSKGRVGTIAYMSPEQVLGESADRRADIFATGVLLYEMLTGKHPFAGRSSADLQHNLVREPPTPLSALRPDIPGVEAVVLRALAKDRNDRWPDALTMQTELLRSLHR